ncbi:DUF4230 domain-containing protein [Prochlorothrix hollandica]|uniref:DUF4230 domain-containing protein n=1 Tax=Prochlorothrix hollandica TaxID=1223 RepID=UPI0033411A8C
MIYLLKRAGNVAAGGLAVAGLVALVGFWRTGEQFWHNLGQLFTTPQPAAKADVRSVAITQIQAASDLTTAIFVMEAVVPSKRDRVVGQFTVGSTTLLFIAYGEVRAGVDLSQLQAQDVQVQGETLQITLPPPKILDSKIDVERSTVYDYDRGFLGFGPDSAPELQTLASQTALQKIVAAACQENILKQANDRAKLVVAQLLGSATSQPVVVITQDPDPATCIPVPEPAPSPSALP